MRTPRIARRNSTLGTGLALLSILGLPIVGGWIAGCQRKPPPAAPVDPLAGARAAIQRGDIPHIRAVSMEERSQFLGSAKCVECHKEQKIQTTSRHARTLARVDPKKLTPLFHAKDEVTDSLQGMTYKPAMKNGRCVIRAVSMVGSYSEEAEAEWALGSGDIGVTFLGKTNNGLTELRISNFGHGGAWDFTPGQKVGSPIKSTLGQTLSQKEQVECFRCHTTALVEEGEKVLPEKSLFGVTCETCHGPGRAHVEAVSQGEKDLKMPRLQNVREHISLGLCGQCHRTPNAVMNPDDPRVQSQLPRLQGVALSQTGCFQKGHVTCVTCHDVHQNADDTPRQVYNQRCMSCHTAGKTDQKACPSRPTGDCVSCHMPAQEVGMPTAPKFRTHWIKVWPKVVEGVS